MTAALHRLPARLTVAEARKIVTDPHLAAEAHWVVREQAWQMVKAVWAVRRSRAQLMAVPRNHDDPKGAA
ncbi:MAG: hypothetical protein ACRCYS_15785 [Beijerinckiaceae bacterium]